MNIHRVLDHGTVYSLLFVLNGHSQASSLGGAALFADGPIDQLIESQGFPQRHQDCLSYVYDEVWVNEPNSIPCHHIAYICQKDARCMLWWGVVKLFYLLACKL